MQDKQNRRKIHRHCHNVHNMLCYYYVADVLTRGIVQVLLFLCCRAVEVKGGVVLPLFVLQFENNMFSVGKLKVVIGKALLFMC